MTTSRRFSERKVAKFDKNITKRGAVPEKKKEETPVSFFVIGFFLFVVVGSSIFQMIRMVMGGGYS